jgi:hypothetical protein
MGLNTNQKYKLQAIAWSLLFLIKASLYTAASRFESMSSIAQ